MQTLPPHASIHRILSILFAIITLSITPVCRGEGEISSILPTWRLFTRTQKQDYVAGYLQGLRDAERIAKLALSASNSTSSTEMLSQLAAIYDVRGLTAHDLIKEIDSFYAKEPNKDKPLFAAILEVKRSR